jgi:hypothetical protein
MHAQVHTFREQKVAKYVDEERRVSIPRHQHHLDVRTTASFFFSFSEDAYACKKHFYIKMF